MKLVCYLLFLQVALAAPVSLSEFLRLRGVCFNHINLLIYIRRGVNFAYISRTLESLKQTKLVTVVVSYASEQLIQTNLRNLLA
jgi:hypothetical protein